MKESYIHIERRCGTRNGLREIAASRFKYAEIAREPSPLEKHALKINFSAPFVQKSRFAILKTLEAKESLSAFTALSLFNIE